VKRESDFGSVCHGEAWLGSFYFKYSKTDEDGSAEEDSDGISVTCPVDVVGSDFQVIKLNKSVTISGFLY